MCSGGGLGVLIVGKVVIIIDFGLVNDGVVFSSSESWLLCVLVSVGIYWNCVDWNVLKICVRLCIMLI